MGKRQEGNLGIKEGGIIVSQGHGRGAGGFGLTKGNGNISNKRKNFPEKSNPRVREEGHHLPLLFFL